MEIYPLLEPPAAMAGVANYKGHPITKQASGRWAATGFILGMEIAERVAFNGISFSIINYMTGPLGESTASAAAAVAIWNGFSMMLPIAGALVADSFLSRYRTIVLSSLLYVLGLGLLTLSAVLLNPVHCSGKLPDEATGFVACPPSTFRVTLFYFALYLVAFAEGGHRPCVQAFGADQFDETDKEESISRSSFFNWWFFVLGVPLTASTIILSYVQDNVNWGLGFGIPCVLLGVAFIIFLLGSWRYRCHTIKQRSRYTEIGTALAALASRQLFSGAKSDAEEHDPILEGGGERMEEAKGMLRLFPIWTTCLVYAIVSLQWSTFFLKQGTTMKRRIGSSFQVPAASLQSITIVTVTVFVVIYDRIFVPLARKFTGVPTGITKLQRIGVGLVLSFFVMVISALVEMKRLETARQFGLIDEPNAVLPMSIVWLFPQYILWGIAEIFSSIGLQEFFYDQVPDGFRCLGIALCLSIFGIGSFINSFLVSVIDKATRSSVGGSWFANNLNRAHLDYFYWLLAGLCFCSFIFFYCYARSYVYKKTIEIGA